MAGHHRDMRDIPPDLEQARNAVMAEVVKAQIRDAEGLASSREIGADRVGRVRENEFAIARHSVDDLRGLGRHVAPCVIAVLLGRVLHVPHKDTIRLEVVPTDRHDFLLPARREDREGDNAVHRQGVGSPAAKEGHQPVQLVQRRPALALLALACDPEPLANLERAAHRLRIERVAPGWLSDGEHGGEVGQVVAHGLRLLVLSELLRERDDIGARYLVACHAGDGALPDSVQALLLGPADPPHAVDDEFVDGVTQGHARCVGALDLSRPGKFALALLHPCRRRRPAVERLALPVNDAALAFDDDFRHKGGRTICPLASDNRSHRYHKLRPVITL